MSLGSNMGIDFSLRSKAVKKNKRSKNINRVLHTPWNVIFFFFLTNTSSITWLYLWKKITLYCIGGWMWSEIKLRQIETCEDMDHSLNRSSWNHNAAVYIFQYNWIEPRAFGNHKDLRWHLFKIDLLKAVKKINARILLLMQRFGNNLFFYIKVFFFWPRNMTLVTAGEEK